MVTKSLFRSRFSRVLMAIAFLGLSSVAQAAERPITIRITGEAETLDWNRARSAVETYLLMNMMEGLVSIDSSLKVVPALAREWKISPDGKTYTFKLRPGVKWSDGKPLRAADFVYSWKRLLTAVTAAPYAYSLFDVVGAEDFHRGKISDFSQVGIKAPDDQTLEVKLIRPVSYWIQVPSFWVTFPLREDIVKKYGASWASPGRMATVGPYVLESRDLDSKIVLKPNPEYYGSRGNVDQVTALIVRDDSAAVSLFESGKIDFMTDPPPKDIKRLKANPGFRTFPYLKTAYLGFAVNKYPLNNLRFRQAIARSIDRAQLCNGLGGAQMPAGSLVPPPMIGSDPQLGLAFNPAQAKKDLAASGVDTSQPISVDLVLANLDKSLAVAQLIQSEVKKNLGVQVDLYPFENRTFRAQMDLKLFPLFLSNWSADYPDPDNFLSVFQGVSGNNRSGWSNAKYDEWVVSARSLSSESERKRLYHDAQKLLLEQEAVIVPLYYEPVLALVSPRIRGLELNPLNYLYLRKVNVNP